MMNLLKSKFRKPSKEGVFVGRLRTRDVSFQYQSPSVTIGAISRYHPFDVTAAVNDTTNPVPYFGVACVDTIANTTRGVLATDSAAVIAGFSAKPYPFVPSSATNFGAQAIGGLIAPPPGIMDVLRSGFIGAYCNGAQSATKGIPVYIWLGATAGLHVQGGCEITPSASAASVAGANTGNGTLGALSVTPTNSALGAGAYLIQFTSATTFNVLDPRGRELAPGTTGTAYSDSGLNFTITAGSTPFVAGDKFTVTATFQTLALPSTCYFNGPGDSTGAVELAFNL